MWLLLVDSNSAFNKKHGCHETAQYFCQPLVPYMYMQLTEIIPSFRKDLYCQ